MSRLISTMSEKYTQLVQVSNMPILILEIGQGLSKVGFAGEPHPRAIVKTPKTFAKNLHDFENNKNTRKPVIDFLFKLYKNHLHTSPQAHKIILIEDITGNRIFFERIVQCLFVSLRVPVICTLPSSILVPYATGLLKKSHLICNFGYQNTRLVPLLKGEIIDVRNIRFLSGNLRLVEEKFKEKIRVNSDDEDEENSETICPLSDDQIEDLVHRGCFILPNSKIAARENNSIPNIDYKIQAFQTVTIPGSYRDIYDYYFNIEDNLAKNIIEIVKRSPVDCRKELLSNIILTGGAANIPGLKLTLKEEMEKYLEKAFPESETRPDFNIIQANNCPSNLTYWFGASLLTSSLPSTLDKYSILRDAYIKTAYGNSKIVPFENYTLKLEDNTIKTFNKNHDQDLTELEINKLVTETHNYNEDFLPHGNLIIANSGNGAYDPSNNEIDGLCLTLAQALEHKKTSRSSHFFTSSAFSSKNFDKEYLENLKNKTMKSRASKVLKGSGVSVTETTNQSSSSTSTTDQKKKMSEEERRKAMLAKLNMMKESKERRNREKKLQGASGAGV